MGRVKISSSDTNVSGSAYLNVFDPKVIRGWWTDLNNQNINTAHLEDTVRFNIETSDTPNNYIIKLQLFDRDMLSPDDDDFEGQQVFRDIKIVDNKGAIDVELPISWTQDLSDEPIVNHRNLYWKAQIGKKTEKIDSHLRVFLSERSLYILPSPYDHTSPQLYTFSGEELIVVELIAGQLKDEIPIVANKAIKHIALAKLEKGNMVTNTGKLYTNTRQTYPTQYFGEDNLIIQAKQGRNFGYLAKDGTTVTTKGINQYQYFATSGTRVQLLGMLKITGPIYDIFNIAKFGMNADNSSPLPIPLPGADILGCMVQGMCYEIDSIMDEATIKEMQVAKTKGLAAVRALVSARSHVKKGMRYELKETTQITALRILSGDIKTYDELLKSIYQESNKRPGVAFLIREQLDEVKKHYIYIIESIFVL